MNLISDKKKVLVIGAGVSGITTAHVLSDQGYQVEIQSELFPDDASADPEYASLFPSASVIPHSVYHKDTTQLLVNSLHAFEQLKLLNFPGVTVHKHYELFHEEAELPDYTSLMPGFKPFNYFRKSFYPDHPRYKATDGWSFNCYFADWSSYFPALLYHLREKGVTLTRKKFEPGDLANAGTDIIINCTGTGSVALFNDDNDEVVAGHLLKLTDAPLLQDPDGRTVSYNFTPGKEVYANPEGDALDVYCYPRTDGWILGGSRILGNLTSGNNGSGQDDNDHLNLSGLKLPLPIMKLNKEIIEHTFSEEMKPEYRKTGVLGFRFTRSEINGLRLEAEEEGDKLIIHNYGHGGAGVTLSWGCAAEVLKILENYTA